MSDMTWKEFKTAVDAALKEAGKDDTETIQYIDISYPSVDDGYKSLNIAADDMGIQITN